MTDLFGRPMVAIRMDFVRHKTAGADEAMSCTELCLRGEEGPEVVAWDEYLVEGIVVEDWRRVLQECATPVSAEAVNDGDLPKPLDSLVQQMGKDTPLYWDKKRGGGLLVFPVPASVELIFCKLISRGDGVNIKATRLAKQDHRFCLARQIVDILVYEWASKAPKMVEARDFLCRMVKFKRLAMKTEAEEFFGRCVAVSKDGRHGATADWVVVVDDDGNSTLFSANAFKEQKARLSGTTTETAQFSHISENSTVEVGRGFASRSYLVEEFRNTMENHRFFRGSCGEPDVVDGTQVHRYVTVLMIREEFCPQPLPEGGIKL